MGRQIAVIGFGEAAQAFVGADGWSAPVRAYDKLTDDPQGRVQKLADYVAYRVSGVDHLADALKSASLVLSLVTADQALKVCIEAARVIEPFAIFCDMNSVAPATKQAGEAAITAAGAQYVDVAIMASANPARLRVPLLLSGSAAALAVPTLQALGFSNVRKVGERVGQASSIKMIRSVIMKGIEALTAEAMFAAEKAGVMGEVLASLEATEKRIGWVERTKYNLDRMLVHGLRRAEEMREVAEMLESLGVDPLMTRAAIEWQLKLGHVGAVSITTERCSRSTLPRRRGR